MLTYVLGETFFGRNINGQCTLFSLQNYASRSTSLDEGDMALVEDLTVLEEKILLKQGLMKIRGKVSILIRSENDDVEKTM